MPPKGPADDDIPMLQAPFADFAQWVFGPDGVRSLRLFAYGDVSYDGRSKDEMLLFCRREPPSGTEDTGQFVYFRQVRRGEDAELWGLFERERHVLEVCPCDSLIDV